MKFKKRTAVAAVVAMLVCLAVYLNWSYQRGMDGDQNVSGEPQDVVSDEARLLGQLTEVDGEGEPNDGVLETTTTDESISLESKEVAVASISKIANNAVTEARIESLVLAKGYSDCAVFLNDDSLSIVVAPVEGGLKSEVAIRIKDIAVSETNIGVQNIRIIEARVG